MIGWVFYDVSLNSEALLQSEWSSRRPNDLPVGLTGNFETACRVRWRDKSYLWRGHNRQRPLLHNTQRNVYLATEAIRFKFKSSLSL